MQDWLWRCLINTLEQFIKRRGNASLLALTRRSVVCCKLSVRPCALSLNLVLLLPSTCAVRKDSARLVFSAPPPQDLSAGREVRATMLSFQAEISVPSILFGFCFFSPPKHVIWKEFPVLMCGSLAAHSKSMWSYSLPWNIQPLETSHKLWCGLFRCSLVTAEPSVLCPVRAQHL